MDSTINEFDLTQEEIGFIRIRHSSKQLAFALIFKYYQKSHEFINDLMKLPAYLINQVASQLNIPPVLLPYKEGLSYLGWINKKINNPSLESISGLMVQLSILDRFNFDSAAIQAIPRKKNGSLFRSVYTFKSR